MPAARALQQRRPHRPSFVMPASGTTKTLRPAELTQILPTGLLVGETRLELGQIPGIIFHFPRSYILGSPESSEYPSASFFERLPFKEIYHNSWLKEDEKREIIASRHAEVIVPGQLDLEPLRFIWCRSEAEKETLLSLLSETQRNQWANKVFHGKKYDLFFSRWSHVDRVALDETGARFSFNRNTKTPGPFDLEVSLEVHHTGQTLQYRKEDFKADHRVSLEFRSPIPNYTIELRLDGCLAYRYDYQELADLF